MGLTAEHIQFTLNGQPMRLAVNPRRRLIDVLREDLGLIGTKEGCGHGDCGSCTVLVDGVPVLSCITQVGKVSGKSVLTIEGLGSIENPHPIQIAFVEAGAVQCGFCTPGMILAAKALLDRDPKPSRYTIMEALKKNLCRCTGYKKIMEAVDYAGAMLRGEAAFKDAGAWQGAQRPKAGVGVSVRNIAALRRATGQEKFAADYYLPDMLYAKVLRSPHAHAEILDIDKTEAQSCPGVLAVLTAEDIPGINRVGRMLKDQPVLADKKVRHVGEPVAVVAAVSEKAARRACEKIRVSYKVLEPVTDVYKGLNDNAPKVHDEGNLLPIRWNLKAIRKGNIMEGFCEADVIVERCYRTHFQEHAYLEPEAGIGYLDGEGRVTISCSTQHPHQDQEEVACVLGLPQDRVRVIQLPTGGGFGGKLAISVQGVLGLLVNELKRPVKLVYDRRESFAASPKRHPFYMKFRTGAKRNGKITAVQAELVADTGAYADAGPAVLPYAMIHASGPYRVPNLLVEGKSVYTNNPVAGAMRGFGIPQVAFAFESQMDQLAEMLGINPWDLRMINALNRGDSTATGQLLEQSSCLKLTLEAIKPFYDAAVLEKLEYNSFNSSVKRGVGLGSIWYGIGKAGLPDPSVVGLQVLPGGIVELLAGAADMGQGILTVLAQIVCEELGIDFCQIRVADPDTALTPSSGATVGSRQTFVSGNAAIRAARALKQDLISRVAKLTGREISSLTFKNGKVVSQHDSEFEYPLSKIAEIYYNKGELLRYFGEYHRDVTGLDENGQGKPYESYHFATHLAVVDVNVKTGEVKVVKIVAAHDVGKAINPRFVEGQIEGGVMIGLGLALKEEFIPGETRDFSNYHIPRITDTPEIIPVILESNEPLGPFGATGIGEPPVMATVPAIINAIYDACGVRATEIPVTPERLKYMLCDSDRICCT